MRGQTKGKSWKNRNPRPSERNACCLPRNSQIPIKLYIKWGFLVLSPLKCRLEVMPQTRGQVVISRWLAELSHTSEVVTDKQPSVGGMMPGRRKRVYPDKNCPSHSVYCICRYGLSQAWSDSQILTMYEDTVSNAGSYWARNEMEIWWVARKDLEEGVTAYLKILSRNYLGGTEESHEKL